MARMNVRILKDRGIYVKGQIVDMSRAQGEQWENSGFAEYVPREKKVAKPKAAPKAVEKPKAEKAAEPKKAAKKKE